MARPPSSEARAVKGSAVMNTRGGVEWKQGSVCGERRERCVWCARGLQGAMCAVCSEQCAGPAGGSVRREL